MRLLRASAPAQYLELPHETRGFLADSLAGCANGRNSKRVHRRNSVPFALDIADCREVEKKRKKEKNCQTTINETRNSRCVVGEFLAAIKARRSCIMFQPSQYKCLYALNALLPYVQSYVRTYKAIKRHKRINVIGKVATRAALFM